MHNLLSMLACYLLNLELNIVIPLFPYNHSLEYLLNKQVIAKKCVLYSFCFVLISLLFSCFFSFFRSCVLSFSSFSFFFFFSADFFKDESHPVTFYKLLKLFSNKKKIVVFGAQLCRNLMKSFVFSNSDMDPEKKNYTFNS